MSNPHFNLKRNRCSSSVYFKYNSSKSLQISSKDWTSGQNIKEEKYKSKEVPSPPYFVKKGSAYLKPNVSPLSLFFSFMFIQINLRTIYLWFSLYQDMLYAKYTKCRRDDCYYHSSRIQWLLFEGLYVVMVKHCLMKRQNQVWIKFFILNLLLTVVL